MQHSSGRPQAPHCGLGVWGLLTPLLTTGQGEAVSQDEQLGHHKASHGEGLAVTARLVWLLEP